MAAIGGPTPSRAPAATAPHRWRPDAAALYFTAFTLLLYLPLVLLVLFSFNASRTMAFPFKGWTLNWYAQAWRSPGLRQALANSLAVALGSSLVATVLGSLAAVAVLRFRFPGRRLLLAVATLPLVVPSIVLAVALLAGATQVNSLLAATAPGLERARLRPFSLWTVGVSHVVIALPMVILIVAARLAGIPRRLEEAAMDLGCSYWGAQRRITLPLARSAILAAFLTAFSSSFDEFGTAFLLAGTRQTLPTYLYSQLRSAYKLPMVVAAAAVIIVASLLLVAATEILRRGGEARAGRP